MMTALRSKGFTLIELMIVIAIIAILMAYAIPAYRDYTVRAKAGEALTLSAGVKGVISEHWVNEGEVATMASGLGNIPAAALIKGNHVNQVTVSAGIIKVDFTNDPILNGESLTITPFIPGTGGNTGSSLIWKCTSTLDNKYLPQSCRTP